MKLEGAITVAAPPAAVWALVVDPIALARCVPGVQDIRRVDDRTFEGTIEASVGPIDGSFSFRSVLAAATFPDELAVEVEGTDSVTRSRVLLHVRANLVERAEARTELEYRADVAVKGRLSILGEMVLRATAGMMIGQVTACLRSQLETPSAAGGNAGA